MQQQDPAATRLTEAAAPTPAAEPHYFYAAFINVCKEQLART
jgi:hypothetical protein